MTVEDIAARMFWCARKARERVRLWHGRQHDPAVPRVTKPPCARRGRRRYVVDAASFEAWRAQHLAPNALDLAA